jgi:hypothetical protein
VNGRALMERALRRQPAERVPTMPQTWYDQALRCFTPVDGRGDWIDAMARCVEDPDLVYGYAIRLAREAGVDGLRLFTLPDARRVRRDGDDLVVLDPSTGLRAGRIDVMGGGAFVPDEPEPPVQSVEEARGRLDRMAEGLPVNGKKIRALAAARACVPDLFVASAPGGITMNTYMALRGSDQAMMDLVERPDFVSEVMLMQAQAMIRRAEALLAAGVDCLYIGDASASASMISPAHFRLYCLPAYQAFCRHFAERGTLIYIHVCGNANPILEMLADTGAHAVEPLDPLGGVSVADAKRRIGGRVALMGGVSTLTLARGSPEAVRAEAEKACREGGPDGYILAAGDMVPPVTPLASLKAMVDVARSSSWKE